MQWLNNLLPFSKLNAIRVNTVYSQLDHNLLYTIRHKQQRKASLLLCYVNWWQGWSFWGGGIDTVAKREFSIKNANILMTTERIVCVCRCWRRLLLSVRVFCFDFTIISFPGWVKVHYDYCLIKLTIAS